MIGRFISIAFLLTLVIAPSAMAGITGILTGTVTDKDKKPLTGVTIKVIGTVRGGFSKSNGTYTITNITAGTYEIRATAVSYDTVTKKISISADQTLTLDFVMTQGGVQMDVVVVSADREMVKSTDVGTDRTVKGKDMTKIARDNIASVLSLSPSIVASGNNFIVRGSRPEETQVLVDGLTVTDQFTGGLGNSGSTVSAAMPSPYATEEVQAKTGGFGAEYGNAVGGIVNTVVKTGRTDKFEGLVRWRKDVPFLWGSANNGIEAGYPLEDVVDVTLGGPLGINRSTFFISVRNTFQNHRNIGIQVMDPGGNNLGMMPNNRTWGRNITGRIKFQLTDDAALLVGGMYGMLNGERSSQGWLYATDQSYKVDDEGNPILDANGNIQYSGFIERSAKQIVVQEFSSNGFAQINHTLGENTVYELRGSFNSKVTETGKRVSADQPDILAGWDLYYPKDELKVQDTLYVAGANKILDAYEYLRGSEYTEDGYVRVEVTKPNPITGFVEGPGDAQTTRNPYGLFGYFFASGNEGGVDLRKATYWQFDGNITHIAELGEARHVFKAGFELRLSTLTRHDNGNPWDGAPFYDVYGSDYGGNLYFDSEDPDAAEIKARTETPYTPVTGGLFVQDQIQFKRLVFTPGLRVDYLDPNSQYRTNPEMFVPITDPTGFSTAESKLYFSPRVTILYPVSDDGRQNFNLSYGVYYQATPWSNYFDAFNTILLRGGSLVGDPNLEMQRTNAYQVAYNHQLSDDFALTVTGYYKDIYNQADIAYVRAVPTPYYQQVTSAYGNTRGLEFTFTRRTVGNWGFNINYTLSQATGTASNNTTIVLEDPFTGQPAFPVEPFALSFDRRHRINAAITLEWHKDEGPQIAGIPFLENFTFNLSGFWQSGLPYTPVNNGGQAIGAINSARFPSNWTTELRVNRTIPLDGLFGGETALDVFLDVTNLLNYTEAVSFYTRTGSPDYDGFALNRTPGQFPSSTYYRDADPRNKATVHFSQYDREGKRLYNKMADFNQDGTVTPEESYQGYQVYVQNIVAERGNYQYPRQVYFGIAFRF